MSSSRDHLFPATSIGRTQGSRLQRVPSHELLTAHPLLSNQPLLPGSEHGATSSSGATGSQRYVPYTPRQRVTPTSATTGTTFHPPSPQHQQGDATSKLQLMNMKSAAQGVGLDTGTVGWAMLEKLVSESDQHGGDWLDIWTAVTTGKATMILPLEQSSTHDYLTADFFKDHIILCDGPSRKNVPIVTLSGLRGTLDDQTLTFRSSLHPSSKGFQDLLVPSTRSTALSALPNLPDLPSLTSISYPTFAVPSHTPAIPLPPRIPSTFPPKPPLPPRPANRAASTSTAATSTSRISNPFASLFGTSNTSVVKPPTSVAPPAPANVSPPASLRSFESHSSPDVITEISAFTIERKIVRKDVGKEINKALRKEVKSSLNEAHLPTWSIDRVNEFTAEWYPFIKDVTRPPGGRLGRGTSEKGDNNHKYVINYFSETPEASSQRLQDFYLGIEQDLRVGGFLGRGKTDAGDAEGEKSASHASEDEKRVQEKIDGEAKIKEAIDVIERTICSLFYDRLYMQPTSDDASHDETLSSRVAALNMLDLGLEHLDINVENAGPELDIVVTACGDMLSQLDACRSPGDKATILVAAHKIVVDGLTRLPPIRLMSEEESKALKAKTAKLREKAAVQPRGEDGKLRILAPAVVGEVEPKDSNLSETSATELVAPEQVNDDLKTPRAPVQPSQSSPIPTIVEPVLESNLEKDDDKQVESLSSDSPVALGASSPKLTMSPSPKEPTPVSGDVLLPLIIFAVVKTNPPRLVSNLLYTQRYRNQSVGGEESYCLINLMAVAEFLENVDLAALGLGDSDKVLSAADLTPIPLNRSPVTAETPLASVDGLPGSLRDRVEQANKVITGVVDSSFGMLRAFLPNTPAATPLTPPVDGDQSAAPWNAVKPGFGLLRRESGFSIKGIASALPIGRAGTARSGAGEESGQQLVTVSRPGSVKSLIRGDKGEGESSELEGDEDSEDDSGGDEEDDEAGETGGDDTSGFGDARSIRSFESMMSAKGKKKERMGAATRKSLTDRLAHMSSLAGLKGSPPSRRATLHPHGSTHRPDSPASSRAQSPTGLHLSPPIQRFVDCTPGDLRLSEVGELLRDYRRLVEGIRAVGGFDE